jgi:hypothetical protein
MGTPERMGLLTAPFILVRAPVRLTLRAAEFGLSTAAEAARIGMELLNPDREQSPDFAQYRAATHPDYGADNGGVPPEPSVVTPETEYLAPEPGDAGPAPDVLDVAAAAAAEAALADAVDAPPPVPDALIPDHVDEDVVLVAETAEPGAEDGAGAELTVEPPWEGYDQMTAADIRDRLSAASAVEAAAVELYESTHKNRRSVMDAAARALSGKTG